VAGKPRAGKQGDAGGVKLSTLALYVIALAGTIVPLAGQFYGERQAGTSMVDFRAYYCASLAVRNHDDPYLVHPLHDCERATPHPYYRPAKKVTVPAPYPPYALAIVAPFTYLQFDKAVLAWSALMALLCLLAAVLLARITNLSILIPWASLALSLALQSLPSGQVVPLCLVLLLAATFFGQRSRPDLSALCLALAMVEPHLALPALFAFFITNRDGRLPLACSLALLAEISLAYGGVAQNGEYFTQVLPAHALSEVSRDNQYSFATIAASLGLSDLQAVFFGNLSYLFMLAVGTLVGIRLSNRFLEPAFTILTPTAFVLLGGTFVHTVEIAAAVPFCLLVYAHAKQHRTPIAIVLVALAIPWMGATSISLFLAPLFPAAFLAYLLLDREERHTWTLATAVVCSCIILLLFIGASQPVVHFHHWDIVRPPIDPRLAEYSWRNLVLGNTTNRLITWMLRAPTWIGLIGVIVVAVLNAGVRDTEFATSHS
jgi:hypothetical protein